MTGIDSLGAPVLVTICNASFEALASTLTVERRD